MLERMLDNRGEEIFRKLHHSIQIHVSNFGLDHPEFGQVSSCFRLLGAKSWSKRVDVSEGRGRGFVVKLTRLRQVSFPVFEVIDFEERAGAFASRRREDRS